MNRANMLEITHFLRLVHSFKSSWYEIQQWDHINDEEDEWLHLLPNFITTKMIYLNFSNASSLFLSHAIQNPQASRAFNNTDNLHSIDFYINKISFIKDFIL